MALWKYHMIRTINPVQVVTWTIRSPQCPLTGGCLRKSTGGLKHYKKSSKTERYKLAFFEAFDVPEGNSKELVSPWSE